MDLSLSHWRHGIKCLLTVPRETSIQVRYGVLTGAGFQTIYIFDSCTNRNSDVSETFIFIALAACKIQVLFIGVAYDGYFLCPGASS